MAEVNRRCRFKVSPGDPPWLFCLTCAKHVELWAPDLQARLEALHRPGSAGSPWSQPGFAVARG